MARSGDGHRKLYSAVLAVAMSLVGLLPPTGQCVAARVGLPCCCAGIAAPDANFVGSGAAPRKRCCCQSKHPESSADHEQSNPLSPDRKCECGAKYPSEFTPETTKARVQGPEGVPFFRRNAAQIRTVQRPDTKVQATGPPLFSSGPKLRSKLCSWLI